MSATAQAAGSSSDFSLVRIHAATTYATAALIAYDYCITFSSETRYIWRPKKSAVFYLFVSLRYGGLCYMALVCLNYFIDTVQGCAALHDAFTVLWVICQIAIRGTFILRCYAIWGRNKLVLLSLTMLALAQCILSAVNNAREGMIVQKGVLRRLETCKTTEPILGPQLAITNLVVIAAFDTLVIFFTVVKTIQECINARRLKLRQGYTYFVLRDGLAYYLVITICLLQALLAYFIPQSTFMAICGNIEAPLAVIVTERFLLNLRQIADSEGSLLITTAPLSKLSFANGLFMGNIGEPLRNAEDEDDTQLPHDDDPCEMHALRYM